MKSIGVMIMIKMIIRMNEEKISETGEYTIEQIYSGIDRIFEKRGMEKKETDKGIEYLGGGRSTDFANFGKIMLGLKDQSWFMENAQEWLYCNSDDSDDPGDYNVEDLLVHYGHSELG
jgi:hypothetical protein